MGIASLILLGLGIFIAYGTGALVKPMLDRQTTKYYIEPPTETFGNTSISNDTNGSAIYGSALHPCTPVGELGGDCETDLDCEAFTGDDDRGAGFDEEPLEIKGICRSNYTSEYFDIIAAARGDGEYPLEFPTKFWAEDSKQCCGACMGDQGTLAQYLGLFGWFVATCYVLTTLVECGVLLVRLASNLKRYSITDAFKDLAKRKLEIDDPDKWYIDASILSLILRLLFGGFMVPLTG